MNAPVDKRARAEEFRKRLVEAMTLGNVNQSALARSVGVDRSTISQLVNPSETRLPNAQVVAECARVLGVSSDWLLGLSERPERPGDVLNASMVVTEAKRSSADRQITRWHAEAAGAKIRHVPATLPDMLKTEQVLRWEYGPQVGRTPDQAIGAVDDRLDLFERRLSDYELAIPQHEMVSFARAEGYYKGLSAALRLNQIDRLAQLCADHYPALRIYLFDARRVFSAPMTVFGRQLAVLYIGQSYISFRDSERVQTFTDHFDHLVREAVVEARDFPETLATLRAGVAD